MIATYTFYDTLDNDKPVLVNAKHQEVCKFLGINTFDFRAQCNDGKLCKGRYRVERDLNEERQYPLQMPEEFKEDWENICQLFRRKCIWVKQYKEGVIKLAIRQ